MARPVPLHTCAAVFFTSLMVAALCAASPAFAQQPWPAKPVRIIIPNSTGAAPDLIARVLADQMTRALGQPWVVDNRPGGEELIAAGAVARAAPDGDTLLLVSQSFVAVSETDTVVRSGEFARRVAEFGWANRGGARTPQETAEYIGAQRERWSKVVKDLGLQPK